MKAAMRIFLCLLMTGLLSACGGGGGGGGSSVGFQGDIANSGPIQSGGHPKPQPQVSEPLGPQTEPEKPDSPVIPTVPKPPAEEPPAAETQPREMEKIGMPPDQTMDDDKEPNTDDKTPLEMVDSKPMNEPMDSVADKKPNDEKEMEEVTQSGDTKIRLNVRTTESRIAPLPVNGLVATRKLSKELPPQIPQFGADSAEESPANKPPPPEPLIVMLGGLAPSGSDFLENDELLARVGQQEDDILVSFGGDEYEVYLPSSFGGNVNAFHRPGAAEKFTLSFSMMITPQPDETSRPWVIADGDFETRAIIAWAPEITDPFTVDLQVVVEYSDGVVYAGQILAARRRRELYRSALLMRRPTAPKQTARHTPPSPPTINGRKLTMPTKCAL